MDYFLNDIGKIKNIESHYTCWKKCQENKNCVVFTSIQTCFLKDKIDVIFESPTSISGHKDCFNAFRW